MDKMNSIFIAYRLFLPETAGCVAVVSNFNQCLVSLLDDDTSPLLSWQHHNNHHRFLKGLLSLCVHLSPATNLKTISIKSLLHCQNNKRSKLLLFLNAHYVCFY